MTGEDLGELSCINIEEIKSARLRISPYINRTPLIQIPGDINGKKVYLKLENLQPVNSFKIRGAAAAITKLPKDKLKDGVYTASAGNFAQGLALAAQQLQVPCRVVVPDNAPDTKLQRIANLGAEIIKVPYEEWWKTMSTHSFSGENGYFIHPTSQKEVIEGNGSVGLEILEDLPEVDTILMPFGGGGCTCGVASAMKSLKPSVKVFAVEVETGAPLSTSLKAGKPSIVENHRKSFVDGMNGKSFFPVMWKLVTSVIEDSIVLTLEEIADAVKYLVQKMCIVAEGAGAAPVAAVLNHPEMVPGDNIVCVISGGNIDVDKLRVILDGGVPN